MTSEYHRAGIHLVCTDVFVYYARVCISACVRGRAGEEEETKQKTNHVHKYIYKCTFDFALQTSVYYIFLKKIEVYCCFGVICLHILLS